METHKVAIVIIVYNISNLITPQIECIRKYCTDGPDIIIVDNSTIPEVSEAVKYYVEQHSGCEYLKTNSSSSNGSASHAFAANLSYLKYKDSYTHLFYLDHDAFPIREFSIVDILGDKMVAGLGQLKSGKKYMWAGCVMWRNDLIDKSLVDLAPVAEYGMDTGGGTYKIIERYEEDMCIFFNEAYEQNPNFTKSFYNFYSLLNDGMFLHFVAASNWSNSEGHEERINSLLNILKERTA